MISECVRTVAPWQYTTGRSGSGNCVWGLYCPELSGNQPCPCYYCCNSTLPPLYQVPNVVELLSKASDVAASYKNRPPPSLYHPHYKTCHQASVLKQYPNCSPVSSPCLFLCPHKPLSKAVLSADTTSTTPPNHNRTTLKRDGNLYSDKQPTSPPVTGNRSPDLLSQAGTQN